MSNVSWCWEVVLSAPPPTSRRAKGDKLDTLRLKGTQVSHLCELSPLSFAPRRMLRSHVVRLTPQRSCNESVSLRPTNGVHVLPLRPQKNMKRGGGECEKRKIILLPFSFIRTETTQRLRSLLFFFFFNQHSSV